jgi:hypothetical protein
VSFNYVNRFSVYLSYHYIHTGTSNCWACISTCTISCMIEFTSKFLKVTLNFLLHFSLLTINIIWTHIICKMMYSKKLSSIENTFLQHVLRVWNKNIFIQHILMNLLLAISGSIVLTFTFLQQYPVLWTTVFMGMWEVGAIPSYT